MSKIIAWLAAEITGEEMAFLANGVTNDYVFAVEDDVIVIREA